MYSAFECGRLATGPDVIADRSQTNSRVLASHDPKTGFPIDGLDRFASMSSNSVIRGAGSMSGLPYSGCGRVIHEYMSPPGDRPRWCFQRRRGRLFGLTLPGKPFAAQSAVGRFILTLTAKTLENSKDAPLCSESPAESASRA